MDDHALDPRELIARTPALAGRTAIACTPLSGGLGNRNYLCTVGEERVVVRIVEEGGACAATAPASWRRSSGPPRRGSRRS